MENYLIKSAWMGSAQHIYSTLHGDPDIRLSLLVNWCLSTIIRYEIVFLRSSTFWFWSWCFIIIDQYHSTTSCITRERSNWPHALFWCRCTTGKHTTEKPITKAVSTNKPIKATPIQSSKQGVGVDACARCRQGFFCSDHGEFVFTVILFLLNWLIPICKC